MPFSDFQNSQYPKSYGQKNTKMYFLVNMLPFSDFLRYGAANLIPNFYKVYVYGVKIWKRYLAQFPRYKPSKSVTAGPGRAGSLQITTFYIKIRLFSSIPFFPKINIERVSALFSKPQ